MDFPQFMLASLLLLFLFNLCACCLVSEAFASNWSYSAMIAINHNNDRHGATTLWCNSGKHVMMLTINTLIDFKTDSSGNKSNLVLETKYL